MVSYKRDKQRTYFSAQKENPTVTRLNRSFGPNTILLTKVLVNLPLVNTINPTKKENQSLYGKRVKHTHITQKWTARQHPPGAATFTPRTHNPQPPPTRKHGAASGAVTHSPTAPFHYQGTNPLASRAHCAGDAGTAALQECTWSCPLLAAPQPLQTSLPPPQTFCRRSCCRRRRKIIVVVGVRRVHDRGLVGIISMRRT